MPTTRWTGTCTWGQPFKQANTGEHGLFISAKRVKLHFSPSLFPLPTSAGSGHWWRPKYQSRSGDQWHCTWEAGGSGKWHIASACLRDPSIAGSVWIPAPNPHISPTSSLSASQTAHAPPTALRDLCLLPVSTGGKKPELVFGGEFFVAGLFTSYLS